MKKLQSQRTLLPPAQTFNFTGSFISQNQKDRDGGLNQSKITFYKTSKIEEENKQFLKNFEIMMSLPYSQPGGNIYSINLISPRAGFLTAANNTILFNFHKNASMKEYPMPNYSEIYSIHELWNHLIVVAKRKNNNLLDFVLMEENGLSKILMNSEFDTFDRNNYRKSVIPSDDGFYLFIREKQNRIIFYDAADNFKRIGESSYDVSAVILGVQYINYSQEIYIFFKTGHYLVEGIEAKGSNSKNFMMEESHVMDKIEPESFLVGKEKKIVKKKILTLLPNFQPSKIELQCSVTTPGLKHFIVSVYKGKNNNMSLWVYKKNYIDLEFVFEYEIPNSKGMSMTRIEYGLVSSTEIFVLGFLSSPSSVIILKLTNDKLIPYCPPVKLYERGIIDTAHFKNSVFYILNSSNQISVISLKKELITHYNPEDFEEKEIKGVQIYESLIIAKNGEVDGFDEMKQLNQIIDNQSLLFNESQIQIKKVQSYSEDEEEPSDAQRKKVPQDACCHLI